MTGNVVLMGIAALQRDWGQAGRHFALLIAFFFGVAASMFLRSQRAVRTGLALEILALMVAGFAPDGFAPLLFTVWVAFFASLQSATFRHVDRFSYNTTFLTGNLRTAAEGMYQWVFSTGEEVEKGRVQVRELGSICAAFFLGALGGAWLAPRFGNRSLFWVVGVLGLALGVVVRAEAKSISSGLAEG
jgi:uncharacterized membrane protein YoaK (UPF0700 family)